MRKGWIAFVAFMAGLTAGGGAAAEEGYRGPTRMNFDERLIKGQTTKAGSVYIFDRQEISIDSLVKRKRSFKKLVIRTVFEDRAER
jgi:hypothetical protein